MTPKFISGIFFLIGGLISYIFRDKIINYQFTFSEQVPKNIRKRKLEVVSISLIVLGVYLVLIG